ncbi:MAG: hypothetical protein WA324_18755 [Bryobacteraceae bacterium]
MKMNKISMMLLKVAAFSALSMGFGLAQSGDRLNVSIPFDFTVGKTMLPAGDYTIDRTFGSPLVFIRDSQYHVKAAAISMPEYSTGKPSDSKVVFRVHGGRHYLASTWSSASGAGREFLQTPAERKVEFAAQQTSYATLLAGR